MLYFLRFMKLFLEIDTMIKTFFLLLAFFIPFNISALNVDSLFVYVPRSVLPLLDTTAKLDLIDLFNNNLPAKAENVLGGQAEITKKTANDLQIKLTDVSSWQMSLLPTNHDILICCIQTVDAIGKSSIIRFYQSNWHPSKQEVPSPTVDQFFRETKSLSFTQLQAIKLALSDPLIEASWKENENLLIYKISLNRLSEELKSDAKKCIHDVIYVFENGHFNEKKS